MGTIDLLGWSSGETELGMMGNDRGPRIVGLQSQFWKNFSVTVDMASVWTMFKASITKATYKEL